MKQKFKLYGKTQEDIESQLLEWQKKNPGLSFKRHPIERVSLSVQRAGFEHTMTGAHIAFSMLIEYEISGPRPRTRSRY